MVVSECLLKLQTFDKLSNNNKQFLAKLSEITLNELAGNLSF